MLTQKIFLGGVSLEEAKISPSQTGQHLSEGWTVLEQVRTGQMSGSQMTVRFCGNRARFYIQESAPEHLTSNAAAAFAVVTWQLQEKHLS